MAASVSSMLRSARSLAARNQSLNDQEAAFTYSQSAQTVDDYNTYEKYLQDQIVKTTDPTKLLGYQKTLTSAFTGFQSNQLQRDTIDVMAGAGSDEQKLSDLGAFYNQAIASGDLNNAQNIEQQYLTTENTIAAKQVSADNAAVKLANLQGTGYKDSATSILTGLDELSHVYSTGGRQAYEKAAATFMKQNGDTINKMLAEAGQPPLPKGAEKSVGSVYTSAISAVYSYYNLASQATAVSDPSASDSYNNDLTKIADGTTNFNSPFGSHSAGFFLTLSQNPGLENEAFREVQTTDSLGKVNFSLAPNTQTGYKVQQGQLVPTYNDNGAKTPLDAPTQQYLENLGFTVGKGSDGTPDNTVAITGKALHWLDPGLKPNQSTNIGTTQNQSGIKVFQTPTGIQFVTGDGKLYTVAKDTRGLSATYATDPVTGKNSMVHGQYGFDPANNSVAAGSNYKQLAVQNQVQKVQQQQKNVGLAINNIKTTNLPGAIGAPKLAVRPPVMPTISGVKPATTSAPLPVLPKASSPPVVKTANTPISLTSNPLALKPNTAASAPKNASQSIIARGATDVVNAGKSVIKGIEHLF